MVTDCMKKYENIKSQRLKWEKVRRSPPQAFEVTKIEASGGADSRRERFEAAIQVGKGYTLAIKVGKGYAAAMKGGEVQVGSGLAGGVSLFCAGGGGSEGGGPPLRPRVGVKLGVLETSSM